MSGEHYYEPKEALRAISEELEAAGLEVRKQYRGSELSEIVAANPTDPKRGSFSINHDGFVTWECTTKITFAKEIREVVELLTVLLSATFTEEMSERNNHWNVDPR